MRFDVVFSFDADSNAILDRIRDRVLSAYPGYTLLIAPDIDLSE